MQYVPGPPLDKYAAGPVGRAIIIPLDVMTISNRRWEERKKEGRKEGRRNSSSVCVLSLIHI